MRHVGVELKGYGKLVIENASGDEYALRIARINITMANRLVAQGTVIALGNQRFISVAHRERNKIICFAVQCSGDAAGHGGDHFFQFTGRQGKLAGSGITDAVGRLVHTGGADDLLRGAQFCIGGLTHGIILT